MLTRRKFLEWLGMAPMVAPSAMNAMTAPPATLAARSVWVHCNGVGDYTVTWDRPWPLPRSFSVDQASLNGAFTNLPVGRGRMAYVVNGELVFRSGAGLYG